MRLGLVLLVCACHAHIGDGLGPDASQGRDASPMVDAAIPDALILGAWGAPQLIPGANTAKGEDDCTMSSSTNELVFAVVESTTKHLYSMSRANPLGAWGAPVRLPFNGAAGDTDQSPRFSADDLTLFFGSDRAGGAGKGDIWMVTRPAVGGLWGTATDLASVNSANDERWFTTCGDGSHYMIVINKGVSNDLYEGTLGAGAPQAATVLNSAVSDTSAFLTQDCLTTFFASTRNAMTALYTSTRASLADPWTAPTMVTDFGLKDEQDPWMATDGRTFVFASDAAGTNDIYLSTR